MLGNMKKKLGWCLMMTSCMAYVSETFEAHIQRGLEVINLFLKRKYDEKDNWILRRLKKYGINTEDEAGDVLRFTYVMHDVGKSLKRYQQEKKFGGHEFVSAYIVSMADISINGRPFSDQLRDIVAIAIFMHHHTLPRGNVKKKLVRITDYLESECIFLVEKYLPRSIKIGTIPSEIKGISVIKKIECLLSNKLRRHYRESYILLIPLMIADNYAAWINRGGKGTVLGKESQKIVELWRMVIGG